MATTNDVRAFTAQLTQWVDHAEALTARTFQGAAFLLFEAVTVGNQYSPGTPVDTGYARNSWWVVVGQGVQDAGGHPNPPDRPAKGQKLGSAVEAAAVTILNAQVGDTILFANGAAYINRLEFEGYSKQAPSGFVRIAAAQWAQMVALVAARVAAEGGGAAGGAS